MDLNWLNNYWRQTYGDLEPEAHQFKYALPDRWVRFHSLPQSKRYADSEAEYNELLRRHHTVMNRLAQGSRCFLVAVSYGEAHEEMAHPAHPFPKMVFWKSVSDNDLADGVLLHVFVQEIHWAGGAYDAVLRAVADDEVRGVFFFGGLEEDPWMYHPYDGGADVILPTTHARDGLKGAYGDWLSKSPRGL